MKKDNWFGNAKDLFHLAAGVAVLGAALNFFRNR